MSYQFEIFSSTYSMLNYCEKPIVIFESHNMAFPVWGCISTTLGKIFDLISLDTHADTRPPFTKELFCNYSNVIGDAGKIFKREVLSKYNCFFDNFSCEDAYRLAVNYIAHDEHIQTACYYGYIDKYFIFCDIDGNDYQGRREIDRLDGFCATYYPKTQIAKLSKQELDKILNSDYILDFDLDYFTSKDIFKNPDFIKNISQLIKNSVCITIAREPEYFESEKNIDENLYTNEEALELLLELIKNALN